jgi:glycerol-3-phosphate dehydrogenase
VTAAATYDLLVVGGGINGTGIACDAAGRGLSVLLCEADDLASGTSSASSKLIHGGLRYLEQYEFRLVREALSEREVLFQKAAHIIWPLRFVLPDHAGMRSRWMIRAGLAIYDNLSRRKTIPASSSLNLSTVSGGAAFRPQFKKGFAYWDCWVDDARLVVCNARGAVDKGAQIKTRSKVVSAKPVNGGWQATIESRGDGTTHDVFAKVIVNATGPWADQVWASLRDGNGEAPANRSRLRLIKGSHIVVPKVITSDDALVLQNSDGRVVFVLPYEGNYSLIGTTDEEFHDASETISASSDEVEYLLDAVSAFCSDRPSAQDVVWQYSGVRALYDDDQSDASKVTRDYRLELDTFGSDAPVLSVLGGKITTYRALAEDAVNRIASYFPGAGQAWTKDATLPGGALGSSSFEEFVQLLARNKPQFPAEFLRRIARRHGSCVDDIIGDARCTADLGCQISPDLFEREVIYLKHHEWARLPDDVLWRRTKAGLHLSGDKLGQAQDLLESML